MLKADASNIDDSLLRFLKAYFPKEAREKQKVRLTSVAVGWLLDELSLTLYQDNDREVVQESWELLKREGPRGEPGCGMM